MEATERLQNELSLLEAMYPGQVTWNSSSQELKYSSDDRSFQLRLPESYLVNELPQVLSATDKRVDVRQQLQRHIVGCDVGEEILDSIIAAFTELSAPHSGGESNAGPWSDGANESSAGKSEDATVIVWLHHLLNTNKRKQAISPPSPGVAGVTKPGYPGVLIYSGPSDAVYEHVDALKTLNWQAFQIRYESEEEWTFAHGARVKEVEAMKDVVAEIGASHKDLFMEVMRMK